MLWRWIRRAPTADLVSVVGLVGEAQRHAEGVVVLLQEGVSVPDLVQTRHGVLELLQPPAEVLLGPRAPGEVGLHHLAQGEVVACIRALTRERTASRLASRLASRRRTAEESERPPADSRQ